jgi:Ca2+-binding RTX toxin-like protein
MDYAGSNGTLTFTAGTSKQTISFTISSDTIVEDDQYFYVDLTSPNAATFLGGGSSLTSKVTILNDDTVAPVDPFAGQTVTMTSSGSLTGTDLNDILTGSSGNDTINGGLGNDIITGMAGADVLTGSAGADKFVYTSFADSTFSSYDQITDLYATTQSDRLALSAASLPSKLWNLGLISASSLSAALNAAYADADRVTTGAQALGSGEALSFTWGATLGTRSAYLVVDDSSNNTDHSTDLFLRTGGLSFSAVGSASVSSVFVAI